MGSEHGKHIIQSFENMMTENPSTSLNSILIYQIKFIPPYPDFQIFKNFQPCPRLSSPNEYISNWTFGQVDMKPT